MDLKKSAISAFRKASSSTSKVSRSPSVKNLASSSASIASSSITHERIAEDGRPVSPDAEDWASMTPIERRRASNRRSQRATRQKRDNQVEELQSEVQQLQAEVKRLKAESELNKKEIILLEAERISTKSSSTSSTSSSGVRGQSTPSVSPPSLAMAQYPPEANWNWIWLLDTTKQPPIEPAVPELSVFRDLFVETLRQFCDRHVRMHMAYEEVYGNPFPPELRKYAQRYASTPSVHLHHNSQSHNHQTHNITHQPPETSQPLISDFYLRHLPSSVSESLSSTSSSPPSNLDTITLPPDLSNMFNFSIDGSTVHESGPLKLGFLAGPRPNELNPQGIWERVLTTIDLSKCDVQKLVSAIETKVNCYGTGAFMQSDDIDFVLQGFERLNFTEYFS